MTFKVNILASSLLEISRLGGTKTMVQLSIQINKIKKIRVKGEQFRQNHSAVQLISADKVYVEPSKFHRSSIKIY